MSKRQERQDTLSEGLRHTVCNRARRIRADCHDRKGPWSVVYIKGPAASRTHTHISGVAGAHSRRIVESWDLYLVAFERPESCGMHLRRPRHPVYPKQSA